MSGGQQGFVLLGVIVVVTVVALSAFVLAREGAVETRLAAAGLEREGLRYAAEAALELGRFRLLRSACEGYEDFEGVPFGDHMLAASYGGAVLEEGDSVTLTFPTDQDTWLKQAAPNDTFGADKELRSTTNGGDSARAVLRFDLSGLPAAAAIESAVANLFVTSKDDSKLPVEVRRVTDAWTETTATWNNTAADYDAAVAATYVPDPDKWKAVPLTQLVRFWAAGVLPNDGVMTLSTSNDREHKLSSKEWDRANERPYLEVTATVGATAHVPMLATATDADGHAWSLESEVEVPIGPAETLLLRDEFAAVAYDGDDGSDPWSTPWIEGGENDGPGSGRIQVASSSDCVSSACLRMGGDGVSLNGRSIEREADLEDVENALLTFRYRRRKLDDSGGSVLLQVSANGGGSWTTLATYDLSETDASGISQAFDLTPWASETTRIRFLGSGSGVEGYFHADDVQIEGRIPCEPGHLATDESVTLPAVADTYLEEGDGSANGGAAELWVGKVLLLLIGRPQHTLARFDVLSTIPANAQILSATLRLHEAAALGLSFDAPVHRVTGSWDEAEATWSDAAAGMPWDSAGGSYDATVVDSATVGAGSGWREWDVTPLVQEWVDGVSPDHGVIVVPSAGLGVGNAAGFLARENVAPQRPELVVHYDEP